MTKDEYVKKVMDAVNNDCMSLSLLDYVEAMEELVSDLESRLEAAQEDLRRQEEG